MDKLVPKDTLSWVPTLLSVCQERLRELQNKLKKVIRDNKTLNSADIEAELGDILWYISQLATEFNLSLNNIAKKNLNKLKARQLGNKISGEGDNR